MDAILHSFKHISTKIENLLHLLLLYQFKYRDCYNTLLEKKLIKIKGKRLSLTCKKDKKVTTNYGYRKSQPVTFYQFYCKKYVKILT